MKSGLVCKTDQVLHQYSTVPGVELSTGSNAEMNILRVPNF